MSFGLSFLSKIFKKKILKNVTIVVTISIFLFIFLPEIYSTNKMIKPAYILETKIPELVEKQISKDCYTITEWPTILTSTTDLKVISTRTIIENPAIIKNILNKIGCVFYFEEGFCLKYPISKPLGSRGRCIEMHEKYDLETYLEFREKEFVYIFYKVSLKK